MFGMFKKYNVLALTKDDTVIRTKVTWSGFKKMLRENKAVLIDLPPKGKKR